MAKRTSTGASDVKSKKRKAKPEDDERQSKLALQPTSKDGHTTKKPRTESATASSNSADLDTSKPSAVFKPSKGRDWTLSLALPGSFIANTTSISQKNELAGRIARAAAIFCVDEIVIYDDAPNTIPPNLQLYSKKCKDKTELYSKVPPDAEPWDNPDQFLFHILSYLECPGHLRQSLFPYHPNLKASGTFPTLDMPHHMRKEDWCQFREGVTLPSESEEPAPKGRKKSARPSTPDQCTYVECGLPHPVRVGMHIPAGNRVTLDFGSAKPPPRWPHLSEKDVLNLQVTLVGPDEPRKQSGYYWGYSIRKAACISDVFVDCPFKEDEGYDVSIGTSERGVPLSSIIPSPKSASKRKISNLGQLPDEASHLLLVFGGVAGIEPAVASDAVMSEKGLTKATAHELFDFWVNLVPNQGSRTIRTEEAVLLGLMGLRGYVDNLDARSSAEVDKGDGSSDTEMGESD